MTSRPLHPARALTHPLGWIALATLALNDHVLEHAAVLLGAGDHPPVYVAWRNTLHERTISQRAGHYEAGHPGAVILTRHGAQATDDTVVIAPAPIDALFERAP